MVLVFVCLGFREDAVAGLSLRRWRDGVPVGSPAAPGMRSADLAPVAQHGGNHRDETDKAEREGFPHRPVQVDYVHWRAFAVNSQPLSGWRVWIHDIHPRVIFPSTRRAHGGGGLSPGKPGEVVCASRSEEHTSNSSHLGIS